MSKEFNDKNFRLVVDGTKRGIGCLHCEYCLEEDGLSHTTIRKKFKKTDFEKTVDAIWQSVIETIKEEENIE